MTVLRVRNGYIFLFSVIIMGAIALATLGSLLLIGIGSLQIGATVEQSEQARSLAQTCVERALRSLWENAGYSGNENVSLAEGTCDILPVGGSGNENRSVCAEGRVGQTVRRYEILLNRILPSIQVYSWREVEQFNACTYEAPVDPPQAFPPVTLSSSSSSDIAASSSAGSAETQPLPDCGGRGHCSVFLMGTACLPIQSYCSIGSPLFIGEACGQDACTGQCYVCPDQGEVVPVQGSSSSSS